MSEDDQKLMAEYGITAETRIVFHFQGHRYERLDDAVNYARVTADRTKREDVAGAAASENLQ